MASLGSTEGLRKQKNRSHFLLFCPRQAPRRAVRKPPLFCYLALSLQRDICPGSARDLSLFQHLRNPQVPPLETFKRRRRAASSSRPNLSVRAAAGLRLWLFCRSYFLHLLPPHGRLQGKTAGTLCGSAAACGGAKVEGIRCLTSLKPASGFSQLLFPEEPYYLLLLLSLLLLLLSLLLFTDSTGVLDAASG